MLNGLFIIVLFITVVSLFVIINFFSNHLVLIFNIFKEKSKLTEIAKSLLKIVYNDVNEIEVCSNCYLNYVTKKDDYWFSEPCVSNLRLILIFSYYVQHFLF